MQKRSTFPSEALWISGEPYEYGAEDAGYYLDHRNHVLSRGFMLTEVPGTAELMLAVLGYALVRVNGWDISGGAPIGEWTNCRHAVLFRSYEVGRFLHAGENTIEIELGNGWYNPSPLKFFGKYDIRGALAEVGTPKALAALMASGRCILATDGSWTCSDGSLLFNNLYLGERVDLRSHSAECRQAVAGRNAYTLLPAPNEPLACAESIPAKSVEPYSAGRAGGRSAVLVDMGCITSGFMAADFAAHAGDIVDIWYAEELDSDGRPSYIANLAGAVGGYKPGEQGKKISGGLGAPETAAEHDRIVCREGRNSYQNRFTIHSFRYALMEGVCASSVVSAAAIPVHAALRQTGSFSCSLEPLNELWDAALASRITNIHSVWEDCPRERLGYAGDAAATMEASLCAFGCHGMIDKALHDFSYDQTERGGIPETAPFVGIQSRGTGPGEGPLLWQAAFPYLCLQDYRWHGDRGLLLEMWPSVRKQMDYLRSRDPEELSSCCLGDHGLVQTDMSGGWKGGTPDIEFTSWATLYGFACMAERLSRIAGESEQVVLGYAEWKDELAAEICRRFQNEDGSFAGRTQTSYAFAGFLGLMDEKLAGASIARLAADAGGILSCGEFGAAMAWRVLHHAGKDETALAWLLRQDAPGLRPMLADGAGTLSESFTDGPYSRNHAMFSSYAAWLMEGLAGIEVAEDAAGADRIIIHPWFAPDIHDLRAALDTCRGEVALSWHEEEGHIVCRVSYPVSVKADVVLGDGWTLSRGEDAERISICAYRTI